jgi:outer membrane PBP1 activator LpoA protein
MTTPSHLRLWRGAGVAAAVIGSQSLVAALPQPGNALMLLPSEGAIAGLGDGLRRGFLLAQDQARICTNQQTDWSIGGL